MGWRQAQPVLGKACTLWLHLKEKYGDGLNKSSLAAVCRMTDSRETGKTRIPFQTWKIYRHVHACTHVHAHTDRYIDRYTDTQIHVRTQAPACKDSRKFGKVTFQEACFGYPETCYLFHKFLYLSVHI